MTQQLTRFGTLAAPVLAFVALSLSLANSASAACGEPPPALLWSYPAEGAQDVPTNAQLWIVTGIGSTTARLNGEPLALDAFTFGAARLVPPAPLAANTDYTLTLEVGSSATLFEVHFRTNDSVAEAPAPAPPPKASIAAPDSAQTCAAVVQTQDCFDTGNRTLTHFVTGTSEAVGYVLLGGDDRYLGTNAVWPGDCGPPTVMAVSEDKICYDLYVIGEGGLLSDPTRACADGTRGEGEAGANDDARSPLAGTDGGCSIAAGAPSTWHRSTVWFLAVFGLLLMRTRFGSRVKQTRPTTRLTAHGKVPTPLCPLTVRSGGTYDGTTRPASRTATTLRDRARSRWLHAARHAG